MSDAIVWPDQLGQTLYVRLRSSLNVFVAAALVEDGGFYVVTDAQLTTAGLTASGRTFTAYKIFIGAPSTSADDVQVASGTLLRLNGVTQSVGGLTLTNQQLANFEAFLAANTGNRTIDDLTTPKDLVIEVNR